MKIIVYAFVIGLLLIGGNLLASTVDDVSLSYQDGATVARIMVDGQVRFIHQTEIPKDGRPYRVIVDVLGCIHNLSAKEYTDLPQCPVSGIRSSQYSVQPEKIVRIVFDMTNSPLYNIESDANGISLTFTDKNTSQFSTWSGLSAVPRVVKKPAKESPSVANTASGQNQAIEKDRIVSLAPAKSATAPNAVPTAEKEVTRPASTPKIAKTKGPDTIYQPDFNDAELAVTDPEQEPVLSPKQSNETAGLTKQTSEPQTVSKPVEKKPTAAAPKKDEGPVSKPAPKVEVKATHSTPSATAKKDTEVAAKKPAASPEKTVAKQQNKDENKAAPAKKVMADKTASGNAESKSSKTSSTSRFRRSPAKIKGTMVAEFPKRLVVKYRAHSRRDPFASLVVESANYEGPIEGKVPNVEGMKLVGIIDADGGANRALLEDKQGYSYILKSGDKVQRGYVLRVEADRVYFQVFEYGWSRTIALHLEDY